MKGKRLIVTKADFVGRAVNWIRQAVEETLSEKEKCHLMLAGGGTPLPVYKALKDIELPWERLILYFGDERCVSPQDPESNYGSIIYSLFPQGPVRGLVIHRMHGEDVPSTAAQAYAAILPDHIDILLLGMGGDGHTASLFPGSSALDETERRVIPVIGSKPPPQRLTITPSVIKNARRVLMMVEGEGKAEAVQRALETGDVPAALASHGDWLMDQSAASALSAQ